MLKQGGCVTCQVVPLAAPSHHKEIGMPSINSLCALAMGYTLACVAFVLWNGVSLLRLSRLTPQPRSLKTWALGLMTLSAMLGLIFSIVAWQTRNLTITILPGLLEDWAGKIFLALTNASLLFICLSSDLLQMRTTIMSSHRSQKLGNIHHPAGRQFMNLPW